MRTIKEIIEANGYVTRSYSGRGMCGKECLAVSIDTSELEFFSDLLDDTPARDVETIAEAMRNACTDSLGRGTILYFPNIEA